MGEIVYKTLIKLALSILALWFFKDNFDQKYFWIISSLVIYFFVIHPAYLAYKNFIEKNKTIINETLCSSCKHFNESAVICMKYDKHPDENFIPCGGNDWEPK